VAPTLNVNALGPLSIQYYSAGAWRALPPNLFGQDWIAPVTYNAGVGVYRLIGFDNRTGLIEDDAGTAVDVGVLQCYGQAISRPTYAGLFSRLGTTYGAGDGSTTFNLPDLRGCVTAGKDDMGGGAAGRLTGGTTLGNGLGSQTNGAGVSVSGSATGTINGTTDGENQGFVAAAVSGAGAAQYQHTHNFTASASLSVGATGAVTLGVVQPTRVVNKAIRL
jgi:microcystin-dependent protein